MLVAACGNALADNSNSTDASILLQLQDVDEERRDDARPSIGKCWHWVTDKLWDGLAWDDQEGDDNFVGKMLNPALGEQSYGAGGSLAMDVSALTLAGIIGLSNGEKERLRSDKSIEGWRVHDRAPCKGRIRDRDVTASCCDGVAFALASFPRLNHVAILVETKKPGTEEGYNLQVLDPTFNRFQENAVERRKPKILMEDLQTANSMVKKISGGMEAKGEKSTGLASYDNAKQYFITMETFFKNVGDLRYPLNGEEDRYRTFKSEPEATVCFGHGPLLQKAAQKWINGTAVSD